MDEKVFKLIYTFFIGVMFALFIGFGISAFYPSPEYPDSSRGVVEDPDTVESQKKQIEYDKRWDMYEDTMKTYNQHVSIIALIAAVLLMMLGVWATRRNSLIANGMVFGGLLTLVYALIRSIQVDDTRYTFAAITIGLLVVLYLSLRHFTSTHTEKKTPAKRAQKK